MPTPETEMIKAVAVAVAVAVAIATAAKTAEWARMPTPETAVV